MRTDKDIGYICKLHVAPFFHSILNRLSVDDQVLKGHILDCM